jgi:hypothetical protein
MTIGMRTKTRIAIRTESDEVLMMRTGCPASGWCVECQAWMLPPDQAAIATDVSPRVVYQLVESSLVHFEEETNGYLLVCLNSLSTTTRVVAPPTSR